MGGSSVYALLVVMSFALYSFLKEFKIMADISDSVLTLKPPLVVTRENCELISSALDSTLTKIHTLTQ